MLKYIAIALLVCPIVSAQPRTNQGNPNKAANAPQLAATPFDSPNVNTEKPSPQAAPSKTPEADRQADVAKAAQAANDRIAKATIVIAIFGVLSFVATCAYIVAAFLQWRSIKKQAENAGDQLKVIKKQSRTMLGTWQAIRRQAETMREALIASEKAEEKRLLAMQGQWKAMNETLDEQRKLVNQNERAVKAAEDNVETIQKSAIYANRAYLGTNRMNIDLKAKKRLAIYIVNMGKSPATGVKATIQVVISTPIPWDQPEPENVRRFALGEEPYDFNLTTINPESIPVRVGFPLGKHFTDEELTLVAQKDSRLTVSLVLNYRDGFDDGFSAFKLTYRGKDSHGNDSWGIFPTASENEYDQTNPEPPEWKEWKRLL